MERRGEHGQGLVTGAEDTIPGWSEAGFIVDATYTG